MMRIYSHNTLYSHHTLTHRERKGSLFHQSRRFSTQISVDQRSFDPSSSLSRSPALMSDTTYTTSNDTSAGSRRKLPKTPPASVNQAELLIEFSIDSERRELASSLIAARGVVAVPYAFILVQVLPHGQ